MKEVMTLVTFVLGSEVHNTQSFPVLVVSISSTFRLLLMNAWCLLYSLVLVVGVVAVTSQHNTKNLMSP